MIDYTCPNCATVQSIDENHFRYDDFVECVQCGMYSNDNEGFFDEMPDVDDGQPFDVPPYGEL